MGLTKLPEAGRMYGYYKAGYMPQSDVPHIVVHADGTREEIPAPTVTEDPATATQSIAVGTDVAVSDGASSMVPLGDLVYGRSGGKGGDANVGVWIPSTHPRRRDAYEWLAATITPERVRELLPEAADLAIEVYPLPNLFGLNILIHGILGEGVASSTRTDPQAKALAEWLRARVVPIPEELLA
jgi:hypothetical protein